MTKKTELVKYDCKTHELSRFEGKTRTHRAKSEFAIDAETIEIFRKNPEFILDDGDDDSGPKVA